MQNKYQDSSVVIQVVQIVIDIDINGQQNQRYGMSQLMANGGKDKTTTCQSQYSAECQAGVAEM
jgi:hypothetical protein